MQTEKKSSKSAQMMYKPVGIASSLVAAFTAQQVFKMVWKHATPGVNAEITLNIPLSRT